MLKVFFLSARRSVACSSRLVLMLAISVLLGFTHGLVSQSDYRMLQSSPHRSGFVNATLPAVANVIWTFVEPDGATFVSSPVVSVENSTAYVTSASGYIYAVDTASGKQRWQCCVGTAGPFPGDPCKNSGVDTGFPYGELTLTSSGDILVLSQYQQHAHPDQLVKINLTDGSITWRYSLDNTDTVRFLSLPTAIPQPGGWDAVVVWVAPADNDVLYVVLNSSDCSVITSKAWNTVQQSSPSALYAPAVFDPMDGTVLSQWNSITPHCDHVNMYNCLGLAKYEVISGAHVWNSSMEAAWTNGNFALDPFSGNVYVSTDQLVGYAYDASTGQPLWQVQNIATATGDEGWPSVCADGTVIFADRAGLYYDFNVTIEREKEPLWSITYASYTASWGVTTLADNTFVWKEGNTLHANGCSDGRPIWSLDFGDTDNYAELNVAASTIGIISVAYAINKGGILVLVG